jgi:glycosyltransferase involved in cell wall biosynthesis
MTDPIVAVYLVTYHRPTMLPRALASVLSQTYRSFFVRVVNDDPFDTSVNSIVSAFNDDRIMMFEPAVKRGATKNFNLMFREREAQFVAMLEDDNWWEPTFLEKMISVLLANPSDTLAVANERIWRELSDNRWEETHRLVWSFVDTRRHQVSLEELCGSTTIRNSSTIFRLAAGQDDLRTPDSIPVDVTEHFREGLLNKRILVVGEPLVNFAETIETARSKSDVWAMYQALLIGSVFVAAPTKEIRRIISRRLWKSCAPGASPRAVSLIATGYAFEEARYLLADAPRIAICRFFVWLARHPTRIYSFGRLTKSHKCELKFLVTAPLTQQIVSGLRNVDD